MRSAAVLLASLLLTGAVQGQVVSPLGGSTNNPQGPGGPPAVTPPAASTPAPAATTHRSTRRTLAERFDAANTTHDGKLTLAQARAGRLNAVARDFAQIHKEKKGYVTMD